MSKSKLSENWEKVKVISGLIASTFIPVVVGIIGYYYSNAIKQKEIQSKYVELAIGILNQASSKENERTKGWAIKVINEYSNVKMDSITQREVTNSEFLGVLGFGKLLDSAVHEAQRGRYHSAITIYDLAISKDPQNPLAYNYKGYSLYKLGEYQNALESLQRSLLLDQKFSWAHYNIAKVYWERGDKEKAVQEIETAIQLHPAHKSQMKHDNELLAFKEVPRFNELLK